MHNLIRQYSRSLAAQAAGLEAGEHRQATVRLLDYYQHTAEAADVHLARHPRPSAAAPGSAQAAAPSLSSRVQAQAWMTAERTNLISCIAYAAARDNQARVVSLTAAMASDLRSEGPWALAVTLHAAAAAAAQSVGDQLGHANALLNLGDVMQLTGDHQGAVRLLEQAREIYRGVSRLGEANALFYLGDAGRLAGISLARPASWNKHWNNYTRHRQSARRREHAAEPGHGTRDDRRLSRRDQHSGVGREIFRGIGYRLARLTPCSTWEPYWQ